MLEEIRKEYENAQGNWTGCDWTTDHGRCKLDLDGKRSDTYAPIYKRPNMLDLVEADVETEGEHRQIWEGDVQTARGYLFEIENDAATAEKEAKKAMQNIERGEYGDAAEHAHRAAKIESYYGDSPTWGRFADMCEELEELGALAREFKRVFGSADITTDGRIQVYGWPTAYRYNLCALPALQRFPDGYGETEKGDSEICDILEKVGAVEL